MATLTQLTWRSRYPDPAALLESMFIVPLSHFELGRSDVISDCCEHVWFTFKTGVGLGGPRVEYWGNVICETGPYQPDPSGDWGVNPVSVLRSLTINKKAPA